MPGQRTEGLVAQLESLQEHVQQGAIKIVAAEVFDAAGGQHLELVALDPDHGCVECAAAEVKDGHG